MKIRFPTSLVLAGALLSWLAVAVVHADEPSADAPPANATPSPEVLKKARENGLKPEVRKGVTVYCWEDADVGSRFKTKKCVNDSQLEQVIATRQAQRDALTHGGGNYGSTK